MHNLPFFVNRTIEICHLEVVLLFFFSVKSQSAMHDLMLAVIIIFVHLCY